MLTDGADMDFRGKQNHKAYHISEENLPCTRCGGPTIQCQNIGIKCNKLEKTNHCKADTRYCICNFRMGYRPDSILITVILVYVALLSCGQCSPIKTGKDLDDIIDLDGEYLTFGSYHNNSDVVGTIQYYFRPDKGREFMPLYHNTDIDLSSPLCYQEQSSSKIVCEYGTHRNVNFYRDESGNIAVAIANENGTIRIQGLVNTENTTSEFIPLKDNRLHHVIKKRWTANMVRKPVSPFQPFKAPDTSTLKKLPDWVSDKGYCIDILCVVDYSIYKKFKEAEKTEQKAMEKIRYYYAHVINGINMRYSTIAQKDLVITVRLAGYFIAKTATTLPFIDADKMANDADYRVDSNYTLTQLDTFLKKMQTTKGNVLPDYNHAMLFLEYASTNLGGSVLGTSFVSGICSDSKSTSLVVDHGAYTSAGIGCHELGHNLGVYWHDGEGTSRSRACNASLNYIMAPASYLIDEKNLKYSFMFSECSLEQIKTHIETLVKLNKNCLQCNLRERNSRTDLQIDKEVSGHMETLPGEIEDVHAQCRQLYGEGSFMCPPNSPEEMCFRMYCYDPKRSACAIISEQMAAIGTPCGSYKICKLGKCVPDDKGKDVPDECPYPDIPSYGAHCEDASPFMCKNDKFKQKCCQSCNKQFTEEEACKDSHILINSMTCDQLILSVFGRPGCASDFNVQNMCCKSCKQLLGTGGANAAGMVIHIGVGSQLGPQAASFRQILPQSFGGAGGSVSNKVSNSKVGSSSRSDDNNSPYQVQNKAPAVKISNAPASCVDDPLITFNQKTCPDIGTNFSYFCQNCQVQSVCCKSCWPHRSKYNSC